MPLRRTVIQLPDLLVEWLDKKCEEGYTKAGIIRSLVQKKFDQEKKENLN